MSRESTCSGYGCDGNCGWRVLIKDVRRDKSNLSAPPSENSDRSPE